MKKILTLSLLGISLVALSGCATIMAGDTQKVNITTSNNKPITAQVGESQVNVPGVIEVQRKQADLLITTSDEKCSKTTVAAKGIEPTFWVNILSGGALGSTTDYSSESMWKYDDNIVIQCGT